jgi:hypothetical protein
MSRAPRRRNVLREIRRGQRDPFKADLKATAPYSRDPKQLSLPRAVAPAEPALSLAPWPEHQVDIEEYIAALKEKEP